MLTIPLTPLTENSLSIIHKYSRSSWSSSSSNFEDNSKMESIMDCGCTYVSTNQAFVVAEIKIDKT